MPAIYSPPPEHPALDAADPGLLAAVAAGHARLTPPQALAALARLPLTTLARWADARCRDLHGDDIRTYVIDRNINYTNVCSARCTFCAFRRDQGDHDAYTLDPAAIHDKIAELAAVGGTQILMQGGMNPALPLDWYLDLLKGIKSRFPSIHIHAFSPPEFVEFVRFFDPPGSTLESKLRWVMLRMRDAGLDSLPGGGGEIFASPVRRKIGLGKCDAQEWLTTMYVAHTLGMFTSATMMFGHIEGYADRVHHLYLVRQWQDRALHEAGSSCSLTPSLPHSVTSPRGHYKSFITWPFQRENTPLGRVRDWGADPAEFDQEFPGDTIARLWDFGSGEATLPAGKRTADAFDYEAIDRAVGGAPTAHLFGKRVRMSSATDYLRTQALARLFLDNVFSIGASWVTMGPHIGQVALACGASDMGSVMMEENVVSAAGTTYCLDEPVLCRLIRDAGFTPAQRNNTYDLIRVHPATPDRDAPDLRVTDWSQHRARRLHVQTEPVARATLTVGSR